MSTHDSRLSKEHYKLARLVLLILKRSNKSVSNTTIFGKMPKVEVEHQKRIMSFLRRRKLVTMVGRSRWAKYELSPEFLRGEVVLPPRLSVGEPAVASQPAKKPATPVVKPMAVPKPREQSMPAKKDESKPEARTSSALVFF